MVGGSNRGANTLQVETGGVAGGVGGVGGVGSVIPSPLAGLHGGDGTDKSKTGAGMKSPAVIDPALILEESGSGEVRNFLIRQGDHPDTLGAVKLPYSERDIKRLGFSIAEVEELERLRRKFSLKYPGREQFECGVFWEELERGFVSLHGL